MTILKFPSNQSSISRINYQVNFFRCSYKFDRRRVTKIIQQIIPALRYVIKKASEFISILNHLFRRMVRPGAQRCAAHADRSTKQSWKSERYKTRNKNPKQEKQKNSEYFKTVPLDRSDNMWKPMEVLPALSPKIVTCSGSPPNAAILLCTHWKANCWSFKPALPVAFGWFSARNPGSIINIRRSN